MDNGKREALGEGLSVAISIGSKLSWALLSGGCGGLVVVGGCPDDDGSVLVLVRPVGSVTTVADFVPSQLDPGQLLKSIGGVVNSIEVRCV